MNKLIEFLSVNDFVVSQNAEVPNCERRSVIIARHNRNTLEKIIVVEFESLIPSGAHIGICLPWLEDAYLDYTNWLADRFGWPTDEKITNLGKELNHVYQLLLAYNFSNEFEGESPKNIDELLVWLTTKNSCFYDTEEETLKNFYRPDYWNKLPSYNLEGRFLFLVFIVIDKLGIDISTSLLNELEKTIRKVEFIEPSFIRNLQLFGSFLSETNSPINALYIDFSKRF